MVCVQGMEGIAYLSFLHFIYGEMYD